MSDVQQRSHRRSVGSLLLELAMIGIGVFLGASAEQWRETRHQRDLAVASLQNFRREVAENRAEVASVRAYHLALGENADKFLESKGPHTIQTFFRTTHWHGVAPAEFKHTAWDLALATQALSDIEPNLAFAVSDVYTVQRSFEQMQHDFMLSTFTPTTFANPQDVSGLAGSLTAFFGDVNIQEPRLLKLYDAILPKIDAALGGPPPVSPKATPAKSNATGAVSK